MARPPLRSSVALLLCIVAGAATAAEDTGDILKRGNLDWKDLLTDNATGPITATAMLGMKGDVVRPVENLRDIVVSLEGLGTDGEKASFGIAVTPARTQLARPSLARYDDPKNWPYRLLTATTFSYAQGNTKIEGADYARRAVAVETGFFLDRDDDPVIAVNNAYRKQTLGACKFGTLFDMEPPPMQPPPPAGGAGAPPTPTPGTAIPRQDAAEAL